MTSKTLTISCPDHLLEFLRENPGLSASKVFQSSLINIRDSIKHSPQLLEANKLIYKLRKQGQVIQEHLQNATEFITIKGLWEEFDNDNK